MCEKSFLVDALVICNEFFFGNYVFDFVLQRKVVSWPCCFLSTEISKNMEQHGAEMFKSLHGKVVVIYKSWRSEW